jgi:hypothetical protein
MSAGVLAAHLTDYCELNGKLVEDQFLSRIL